MKIIIAIVGIILFSTKTFAQYELKFKLKDDTNLRTENYKEKYEAINRMQDILSDENIGIKEIFLIKKSNINFSKSSVDIYLNSGTEGGEN